MLKKGFIYCFYAVRRRRILLLICGNQLLGSRLGEFSKSGNVVDGDVGQNFAVHFDAGHLETVHQTAVRDTAGAGSRIDAGNPQGAEIALFGAAVSVGIVLGVMESFLSATYAAAAGATVAFNGFHQSATFFNGNSAALNSGHVKSSNRRRLIRQTSINGASLGAFWANGFNSLQIRN